MSSRRVAAGFVVAALALAACRGDGDDERAASARRRPPTTTSTTLTTDGDGEGTTTTAPGTPLPAPVGATAGGPAARQPSAPTTVRRAVPSSSPTAPSTGTAPALAGCTVFPGDNPWNADVSRLPVHPNSANFIASIGASGHLHADFGENQDYGIPFVVARNQEPVPISYTDYGDESDPGPFPIPLHAPIEHGSDRHVLALDADHCVLYELFNASRSGNGWAASSGARWPLDTNRLRPEGWTSADAAGLPILPGLVRHDEVAAGAIRHALRFTVARTQRGYILPATHFASNSTDPNLPPMGLRVRLKAGYDISRFTGQARVVLEALRRFGMIVADNGSNWFISGATNPGWNDDDLNQLKTVPGFAFEAVDTGPIRGR